MFLLLPFGVFSGSTRKVSGVYQDELFDCQNARTIDLVDGEKNPALGRAGT